MNRVEVNEMMRLQLYDFRDSVMLGGHEDG